MGDPKFINKSKLTKNDILNYMLSEVEEDKPVHRQYNTYNSHHDDSVNDYRNYMDTGNDTDEEDDLEELEAMRQREWDEQEEYEQKMHSIHDRYPDFDAEAAISRGEDPEAAERDARLDDFLLWW